MGKAKAAKRIIDMSPLEISEALCAVYISRPNQESLPAPLPEDPRPLMYAAGMHMKQQHAIYNDTRRSELKLQAEVNKLKMELRKLRRVQRERA